MVCFCFGGWSPCVEGGGVVRGVVRSVSAPTELLLHSVLQHRHVNVMKYRNILIYLSNNHPYRPLHHGNDDLTCPSV